ARRVALALGHLPAHPDAAESAFQGAFHRPGNFRDGIFRNVGNRPGASGITRIVHGCRVCYRPASGNRGIAMNVLVVGSGGREHALCWALAASPLLTRLWCAPGNPGIASVATCVPIGVLDLESLVAFAQDNAIDLVVPGPEAPLVAGITDEMEAAGIACCGPSQAAAQLEGSKTFTKEICDQAGIPTALWERFEDAEAARAFIRR